MKGFRTLIAAGLTAAFGFLQTFDWSSLGLTPHQYGWILCGLGVGFAVLRATTTTPVGQSV